MRITKEQLKQIIKEEIRMVMKEEEEQEQQPKQQNSKEDLAVTKAKFSKKLVELSKAIPQMSGLEVSEMQLVFDILTTIVKHSSEGAAKVVLQQIKNFTDKKIGV
jgi:hypothetical protein